MRFLPIAFVCALVAPAHAGLGIGASVADQDAAILFPIRLSSVIVEPYLGYQNRDVEVQRMSTEARSIGIGVFGLTMPGENLSLYYGARLADLTEESSSVVPDFVVGEPVARTRTDVDGYVVTPAVGIQYAIGRVMVGAEIGWEYREVDQRIRQILLDGNVTVFDSSTTTVSRGTHASVVFRYFF